jgi:hypothetical protein
MKKQILPLILLFLSCQVYPVKAESTNHCTLIVSQIAEELYEYGTSVYVNVFDNVDEINIGNPTNRTKEILFTIGKIDPLSTPQANISMINKNHNAQNIAYNISNSTKLQQRWADNLVSNCKDIAVVSFGIAHTSFFEDYAIQSDGLTQKRKCVSFEPGVDLTTLPWNYQLCGL